MEIFIYIYETCVSVCENAFPQFFLLIDEIKSQFLQPHLYVMDSDDKCLETGPNGPIPLVAHVHLHVHARTPSTHTLNRHSERIMGNSMHGAPGEQTQPPRYCNVRLTA